MRLLSITWGWPTIYLSLPILLVCTIFASTSSQTASSNDLSNTAYHGPAYTSNATSSLFPMSLCNGIRLEEATIDQLQHYMEKRRLTSVQIVECYLQRLFQVEESIKCVVLASTSSESRIDPRVKSRIADEPRRLEHC